MKIRYEVIRVDEPTSEVQPERYVFHSLEDAEKSVERWVAGATDRTHFHILKRYQKG